MSEQVEQELEFTTKIRLGTRQTTSYAHHMTVQDDDNDVIVSFYETQIPLIPNEEKERQKVLEELSGKGVFAECIAKIRIAKLRLPIFVKVLADRSQRIEQEMKQIEDTYGIDRTNEIKS